MNIPLDELSGSKATNELQKVIEDINAVNTRQTRQMLFLTWAIAGLTVMMLVAVIVQIVLILPE